MFRSLRHRNARLFFLGLLVSNVGSWIQLTATSLVVYELTGNATDAGINLFCQFLPMLLLGSWAGAVADRVDKRKMAIVTQSLQAVQGLTLGVLYLTHHTSLPVLYGLSVVLGVVGAFDNPARRGFVIELVEPEEISNAVSLNTAVMTGSRIVGPALAAFLKEPLGAGWLFIINGVSFVAILWPLLAIDLTQLHRSVPARRGGTPVRDAVRFIRDDRRLAVVFVVFALVGTFAFNYSVSLLRISDVRYDDRRWFGILLGIPVGLGGAAFIAGQNAILQDESPPDMRGRLLALSAVAFLGSTPIGSPITGWIADRVSAEWSLAYGSVITLVAVTVGVLLRRRSERRDVPAHQHQPASVEVDGRDGRGVVPEAAGG